MSELLATTQPAEDLLAQRSIRGMAQAQQSTTPHDKHGELIKSGARLRQILAIEPENPRALAGLGRVLKALEQTQEALAVLKHLTTLHPDSAEAHFLLAMTLAPTTMTKECISAYDRSLALDPNQPAALLGLGHALKASGRGDDAIQAYQRCIALRPDSGEPYQSLANMKTYRFTASMIAQMQLHIASGMLSASSEINFHFAVAKALEDQQDYTTAWQFYRAGNNKKRSLVHCDNARRKQTLDKLKSTYSHELFAQHRKSGGNSKAPIFIVGMPRSGSTLIEQILASHASVEAIGEKPYIRHIVASLNRNDANKHDPKNSRHLRTTEFSVLGQQYLQMTEQDRQQKRPHFVDKMPVNFLHVGFIHTILPHAKIIDARRHPLDTCVGNLKQLYARGQNFSYSQVDIGQYYLQYQAMMDHWDAVLPGKVLRVQYEDTVHSLETQVGRLLDYLELPWEDNCLRYNLTNRVIRSASSEQVRLPLYNSSIGSWKNYEPELGELKSVLAPILHRYP
jgi:tetratricopeptide (TPR) repeat protein